MENCNNYIQEPNSARPVEHMGNQTNLITKTQPKREKCDATINLLLSVPAGGTDDGPTFSEKSCEVWKTDRELPFCRHRLHLNVEVSTET
jgi:hypothetical protein